MKNRIIPYIYKELVSSDTLSDASFVASASCSTTNSTIAKTSKNYTTASYNGASTVVATETELNMPTTDPVSPPKKSTVIARTIDASKILRLVMGDLHEDDLTNTQAKLQIIIGGKIDFAEIEFQVSTDGGSTWKKAKAHL